MVNNTQLENKRKVDLPYDVILDITETIVQDLNRVGSKGMNISELFQGIAIKSKPLKSHALDWCKFFKLVKADGRTVTLTTLGFSYANSIKEQKNNILTENVPDRYTTILKWINDAEGSMRIEQIKNLITSNWGYTPSKRLFDSMLNTFARTCETIGLLKYIKGPAPRCELTKAGLDLFSLGQVKQETKDEPQKISDITVNEKTQNKIIIVTEFGKFESPVSDKDDWDVAELRLKSWRKKWEETKS